MSKMSDAQRRKIFILSKEKRLDDETLRAFANSLTGKSSFKDLSIADAIKIIDALEGKKQNADNMITDKQRKLIEGLAKELGFIDEYYRLDRARFNGLLSSKFHIDDINWLTSKKASDVIQGLLAMKGRGWKAAGNG